MTIRYLGQKMPQMLAKKINHMENTTISMFELQLKNFIEDIKPDDEES